MMTKAEAALTYASWGWHVIPVVPNGKVPATQHGVKDATTDPVQIARWWAQNPDFNIGIAAGERSGIVVFDVDPRNGGDESWSKWLDDNGQVPDGAAMQMTAGGGEHHIAIYDPEIRSCKLTEGVDLLADGRYFVAFPSTIEGRRYEWEASSDPFDGVAPFTVPDQWMTAYRALRKPAERQQVLTGGGLIQGSRNNGLTAMGGVMRRYGFSEAEIMASLSIANETRCEIPLPSSELSQIVRSVSRYEPEGDVAADTGLGYEAAEAILAATKAETQEYYFTRATSYLGQPAPLKWIIKGWMPDSAVSMVYGESGVGKTFITLDMACHIAAGLQWHGHKTKAGLVVYMAGEGNYGIRQRVTAWCKAHGVQNLDHLLISNKAIDVDSPAAAAQIINAVREVTQEDAVALFIDTVNNHMSGDENSAKDTRNMLNACNIVSRALNASICLNHHTGHAADSKQRARGSSAWKASLDASILVAKTEGSIEIACTKMKDAEPPKAFFGKLEVVPLGWIDEDGEEIKGAVFKIEENPPEKKEKKESEIQKDIRKFTNAWWHSGAEERNNSPYISRSALIDYLMSNEGLSESTAKTYSQESKKGRLIYNLLNSQIISPTEHGWMVIDDATESMLMVRKAGK
ncbi:regulatory protein repA [Caudoviricetes sp.]|nr:regulatory protein repA [Caudoviricetes sp.]